MSTGTGPRIGLIGARRARQGLGPFVARHLRSLGAQVVGHVGTTEASAARAAAELQAHAGVRSRPFVTGEALVAETRPQALVILTPPEHHARWLDFALEQGLPALCEKPLVWDLPDAGAVATRLVEGFRSRGLLLAENCQWPFTIPTWDALFPGARSAPPRRFEMLLSPMAGGPTMLGDSLPHALSLLQALAPARASRLAGVEFSTQDGGAKGIVVRFDWPADAGAVAAQVTLKPAPEQPRDAAWGVDGQIARRHVALPDYRLSLAAGAGLAGGAVGAGGERRVPLPDPLVLLLKRFLADLHGVSAEDRDEAARRMVQRMDALCQITTAFEATARP